MRRETASRGEAAGLPRDRRDEFGRRERKKLGVQRLPGLGVRSEGSGMKIQTGDYENRCETQQGGCLACNIPTIETGMGLGQAESQQCSFPGGGRPASQEELSSAFAPWGQLLQIGQS